MKAEQKIVYKRLEALKLAEELGNITKVCKSHPFTTSKAIVKRLLN